MAPPNPKHTRIPQLDGVRALAILSVFLAHALDIPLLWAGVDLFFILSGFLITGILLQQKSQPIGAYFRRFYSRRAVRILPPYLLLLVVTTLFFGPAWMRDWYFYLGLMNFMTSLSYFNPPGIAPLWSLAVEEQFYLLWPFAVYFLSRRSLGWLAGVLVLAVPVARAVCTPMFRNHYAIYELMPFRMDLLLVGALLALAWEHRRDAIQRFGHFGLLLVPVAAAGFFWLHTQHLTTYANSRLTNVWVYEFSLFGCTGLILWALSGRFVRPLTWAPVVYLGRISYTFYLIHVTAIVLVQRFLQSPALLALLSAAITLLYSALSWRFLEKPLLGGARPAENSVLLAN